MIRWFHRGVLGIAFGVLIAGCGYTTQSSLAPEYQTIAVSPFFDKTPEYGLQAPLTNAVTRKFINDSRLQVVDPDSADLLLEGVILGYQLKGLTFDQNDQVTQYLMVVTAGVRVTDQRKGEVLWEDRLMSGETSYYTRAAGQSSDRLRGNVEVFLPTVRSFASDEENRAAAEALEQLASDIFYRTVEPWPGS
jgi:hypothetical protein